MCLPKRYERGTELGRKEFGLLPRREVPALVDLMEVDEVAIGAPGPCLGGAIDVLREYRDGDRERDLAGPLRCRNDDAASCAVLPVQPSCRGGGVCKPVQRDVVRPAVFRRSVW